MKILVLAHRLEVGGTQVNAIELSAYLRNRYGHEISYLATPGPMNALLEENGLRFLTLPDASSHPSYRRIRAIDEAINSEHPDVVHIWDWPQWLDAFLGVHLYRRVPTVVTCMSMVVPSVLPRWSKTTFGTPDIVEQAQSMGYRDSHLLMPPVDTVLNAADPAASRQFRDKHGVADNDILIVTVSRLVDWMKAESLRLTMEAIQALRHDERLKFAVIGDGSSRGELEELANRINSEIGRKAIFFTGAMLDPRPGYAAADIVVGMGGSGLRGMAFAKPVIVVGEQGFSAPFTSQTEPFFYHYGIYGQGTDNQICEPIAKSITRLVETPGEMQRNGQAGRNFIEKHYSIEAIGDILNDLLVNAASTPSGFSETVRDTFRTAFRATSRNLHQYLFAR